MPDTRSIVKKMIAAGESEEDIAAVIKRMNVSSGLPDMSPALPDKDEYKGPDTFEGGFKKSLFSKKASGFSEAMEAGAKGALGWAKGAIADIPETLAYGAKDLLDFHLNPGQTSLRMAEGFKQIPDIVKNAGADPEAFGRMVGQFTGQPAALEGLGLGALRARAPVGKVLSKVGGAMAGTPPAWGVPITPKGAIVRTARAAVAPTGRAMMRAGEKLRLSVGTEPPSSKTNIKLKGETETPHSPDSDIFAGGGQGAVRPRPVRHDTPDLSRNSEFTRLITETAEELAARKRPSVFTGGQSRRNQSTPFEPRPLDTTPYPRPGEIPPGIPGEAPLVRDTTPYEPPPVRPEGLPPERSPIPTPDPIPVGEGGQSSRYQSRPFEFGQEPIGELGLPSQPKTRTLVPEPLPPPFNPGNRTPPDLTQPVAPPKIDSAFGQVDPTTGEIIPPLRGKKLQGKWNRPDKAEPDVAPEEFEFGPDEPGVDVDPTGTDVINDAGRQFADEVEAQRYPGDEAFDLGELNPGFRSTQSMPDWGQQSPRPVNPLRPEVPPGQVTNRQMFQNSAMRGAETPSPGRQFADSIGHEFDQDMMFAPGELNQPDIPPMMSPVENIFDPRTSGLAPEPDIPPMRTIAPEEWGDWGGLEKDIPTLVPDESGSHVAAPREGPAEFSGPKRVADTADDAGRPRDVRWDAETESYFDRNTRNWEDVIDATPEEISRAKKIGAGIIPDPTGGKTNFSPLDLTERGKRGQGQNRLNSMFGEETGQRLGSSKNSFGASEGSRAIREAGRKQLDRSQQAQWNSWADEYLEGIPSDPNKPGLNIYDSGQSDGPFKIVYRNAQGNPIGTLETGEFTNGIKTLAVSTKIGLGRGHVAFKMLKEAIDRGITEATGPTSNMTKNIIERVKRVIDDSKANANDSGPFGNSELELEINKILDGTDSPEFSSTPDESMGFAGSEDIFATANDEGPGRLVKKTKEKNFPSVIPEGFEKVGKGRQVGAKGEAFRVTGPDGKHLGDISITEKQIKEIQKHPNYSDMPREEVVKAIHDARLETILEEAGIAEDAMSRVKVEPLDGRLKRDDPVEAKSQPPMPYPFSKDANDVGNYGAESLTDYSGTSRASAFPNAKPKVPKVDKVKATTIDPDVDFGPGGNIEPIIQEARRLDGDKAVDSKYKSLLPKEMRGEIGPGETYKGKLQTLIKTIQEELGPEQGAQRLAEMDAFNDSLRGYPQEQSNIPPLDPSTIDVSKLRQGKLNRQPEPWISPRMVQQFPDLARKLKAQNKK